MSLSIHNLTITRDGNEVVRGVSLELPKGELHVLMGKNGSGKSSLAAALMGHPAYVITGGTATLDGEGLLALAPHERSRKGLFLSPQHPPEVAGVSISNFLRTALGIDASFAARNLNEGFSGGERKRMELLQLAILAPQYAVLDEMDSGLDVDAVKAVAAGLAKLRTDMGVLAITHRPETLASLSPDKVYVMDGGRIVETGGPELAERISREGFGNP
jgi:Fe-S cluster assembly ATP-binding protein